MDPNSPYFEYSGNKRPYSWTYAPTDRAACKGQCKQKIPKGGLRFGYSNIGDEGDLQGTQFRCLDCVTDTQIKNVTLSTGIIKCADAVGGLDKVDGFSDLTPQDQARIVNKQNGGTTPQKESNDSKIKAKSKSSPTAPSAKAKGRTHMPEVSAKKAIRTRPKVGDRVKITTENDPGIGLLARLDRRRFGTKGLIGEVVDDVGSKDILTFKVKFGHAEARWYKESWVEASSLPASQLEVVWLKQNSKPLDTSVHPDSVHLAWYGIPCLLGQSKCGEEVTHMVKELLRCGKPVQPTGDVFHNLLSKYDTYSDAALFIEILSKEVTTQVPGVKRKAIDEKAPEASLCVKRQAREEQNIHEANAAPATNHGVASETARNVAPILGA